MNDITHTAGEAPARLSAGKFAWGIVLLGVGALAFVDAIDFWEPWELWHYWPVILIVIGISNELDTLRTRQGDGGGYIMLAIGVWMLAASQRFLGLDYRTAFPLAVVIAGMGIILHALVGVEDEKEKQS